jgi:hypothetical protein
MRFVERIAIVRTFTQYFPRAPHRASKTEEWRKPGPAWISQIETSLSDFSFSQEEEMLKIQEWARDDPECRLIRAVYRNSGIARK